MGFPFELHVWHDSLKSFLNFNQLSWMTWLGLRHLLSQESLNNLLVTADELSLHFAILSQPVVGPIIIIAQSVLSPFFNCAAQCPMQSMQATFHGVLGGKTAAWVSIWVQRWPPCAHKLLSWCTCASAGLEARSMEIISNKLQQDDNKVMTRQKK